MARTQRVALWLGTATSQTALERCLQGRYSSDGDYINSSFESALRIRHPETALHEVTYYDASSRDLTHLLDGNSYADQLLPQFLRKTGTTLKSPVNSVVLFYDFTQKPAVRTFTSDDVDLKYVGEAKYTY